jgi:UDP-glucose 4-epimerase
VTGARYVVTGGAGFIGSHVVERLLARGDAATVLDDFSTGRRQNVAGLRGDLRVVEGSITRSADVEAAFADARAVIHLAALPSVTRSVEAPLDSHHANATGTLVVLDAARRRGLRVVYAGSSSAYGDQQAPAKSEDLREDPLSPYAAAKLAGELYCRSFARVYRLPVVITRFFNVFGPRQVADSPYSGVVAAFCLALLEGRRPRIDGDGSQSRDFTYVTDVVDGVLLAADSDLTGCHVINLACGGSHTVSELLAVLARHAGVDAAPVHGPSRNGDVKHSLADVTAAREKLGYRPRVGFAEGLALTFDWYRRTFAEHP